MSLECSVRIYSVKSPEDWCKVDDITVPFDQAKSAHTRTCATGVPDDPAVTVPSNVPIHGALK
jgi:hypothetical protein